MENNIKRIVVVGGGTSGWWAAGYLSKMNPELEITVIESPNIPKIGVGESVLPMTNLFFNKLGIDEKTWMKECDAIYKLGNLKQGWNRKDDKEFFWGFWWNYDERMLKRSLNYRGDTTLLSHEKTAPRIGDYWWDMYVRGEKTIDDFNPDLTDSYSLVKNMCQPYYPDGTPALGDFAPYTYHVNAELTCNILRDQVGIPNGVKHILATVANIDYIENEIKSITLDSGKVVTADLWIDCTGFRKMLIGKFNPEIKPYPNIRCNSAVVAPFEYRDRTVEQTPYTRSLGKDYGWQFIVTLNSRIGSGYVFDRNLLDPEQAKKDLLSFWPNNKPIKEPRLITWDPGRLKDSWISNCVAIGLSSFFIDPLEANGVFGIEYAVETLSRVLKRNDNQNTAYTRRLFSVAVGKLIDATETFISHHYMHTDRDDTEFWRFYKDLGKRIGAEDLAWGYYMNHTNTQIHHYPSTLWLSLIVYFNTCKDKRIPDLKPWVFEHAQNHFKFTQAQSDIAAKHCIKSWE